MPALPPWAIGADYLSCVITPQTIAATTGTLTDGVALTQLVGLLEGLEISEEVVTENIVAHNSFRDHEVQIGGRTQITLTEILRRPANTAILAIAGNTGSGVVKITIARGTALTAGAYNVWTFYGQIKSYRETMTRGKCTAQLVLTMVESGSTNPTYATG